MNDYVAVLDACVLVPACLRDTLLRLAEEPRLYVPKWSGEIIQEMVRTLQGPKFGLTHPRTKHLIQCMEKAFPEAWVTDFEPLISVMTNDPKDRHVLAAALKSSAETIITFNTKHFPEDAVRPWGIQAQTPDEFLIRQYDLAPELMVQKLVRQSAFIQRNLQELLPTLRLSAPRFVEMLQEHLPV